tara:strand:- start:479 stop:1354 length:876 start_codon:yes stop_codon:yes gene_type:complete
MLKLLNGDCLELMKDIEDKSVNLILTDPPYNINHNNLEWDNIDNYVDFMISVFKEGYRVLKKNGSLYFFHNDFKQIAELQIAIEKETNFRFQRFITITKDSYITKLYPNCKSWINCCEYVLVYTKHENREQAQIDYFQSLHKQIGKTKSQIKKDIPLADHAFRVSINNFALPTEETYKQIIELYNLKDCKGLEELRTYKELKYIYNGKSQPNYIHANFKKNKLTSHSCEKPQELLINLISTASNEGDVVLDPFMGCGSCAIACNGLNRDFIGIEKDINYFNEAKSESLNLK